MSRRAAAQGNGDPVQEKDPMSQRRLIEDVAGGSRDTDAIKLCHVMHPQPLSDSENEEPSPRRTIHRSAFVSKNNTNCFTWSIQSKLERSQSCSETINETFPLSRRRASQLHKTKTPPSGGGSSAGFIGVLLSTENSRSFSAPVLTSEKGLPINSLNSFTPLHKPERSISPESNDSISEELNHFKPIVCSPCTPPKRLPDGRVLSPVLIKSTPRNLRRNLQKPTTYEASPMILKKWEQVFQDRQMKKTLSKGTLTLSAEDGLFVKSKVSPSKEVMGRQTKLRGINAIGDVELFPSSSKEEALHLNCDPKTQSLPCSDCFQGKGQHPEPIAANDFLDVNANVHAGTKTRLGSRLTSSKKTISQCKCLVAKPIKPSLKRAHKKNSQPLNLQNGSEKISPAFPQRRGQKRRCKTKHLEQNGSFKRLRVTVRGSCSQGGFERLWREAEKKLHQEEEDKKLALKLQQMFDKESRMVNRGKGSRMVNRGKGSRDEYHLRSKSTAGAN
ncbi:E3 ubiquitin-protein ligase RNF169 [Mixophyes fleayi]|uniref:E3 ubiquitin-protein ligase RNF169 n=1 Tax=Mixophyes fleayi TaxID=3061075 RepID=UPI003F4D8DB5